MSNEREVMIFNDSFERCCRRGSLMFDLFYERFLASCEQVSSKFQHTDLPRQKRLLRASLYIIMTAAQGSPEGLAHIEHIAQRHSKSDLDIPPLLYDIWLQCLLEAVQESDPKFNEEIEHAWRQVIEPGIETMKARYDRSTKSQ